MKFYISRYTALSQKMQPCKEALLDDKGRWHVEIHSIGLLIRFLEKYQTLHLEHNPENGELSIEIFDDWSDQA